MLQAIAFVASAAISWLFPAEGPRLKDLTLSASTYGNIIPEVFGRVRVGADMIWSSGIKEHKKKVKAGVGSFYNKYTYTADFAMAFCKGPAQLRRIWANGKLIYDATGLSQNVTNGKYILRFYAGDEDQLPDSLIQADKGAANTPAYRGLAYCVFERFSLTDYGNQLPQMAAEVYVGGDSTVAVIDLVQMGGGPVLTTDDAGNTVVDFDRGYIYIPALSAHPETSGIRRFRLSDGVEDRQATSIDMGISPTTIYDTGNFQTLFGVTCDGTILASSGLSNFMEVWSLDPNSLSVSGRVGVTTAFSPPGIIDTSVKPFFFDTSGTKAVAIGLFGDIYYFTYGKSLSLSPGTVKFGTVFNTRTCAVDDDGSFYVMYGGGTGWATPDQLSLAVIGPEGIGASGEGVSSAFTLNNPNPGSSGFACPWLAWDSGNPGLLLFYQNSISCYVSKWNPKTGSLVWTLPLPGVSGFPTWQYRANRIILGQVAFAALSGGMPKLWIIDTINGTFVDQNPDPNHFLQPKDQGIFDVLRANPGASGYALPSGISLGDQVFDGQTGILVCNDSFHTSTPAIVHTGAFQSTAVTLGFIVERLLRDASLTSSDFDLTPLYTINVHGYGFAVTTDLKSILTELRELYLFDLIESDGVLVASLKGGSTSVETISYKALGSESGNNDTSDYWKETRASEADIPGEVSFVYMNLDNDFQSSTALSKRISSPVPTMFSRQKVHFEISVVMSATEAKTRANAILYVQWAERTKHNTKLPWAYAYLDPTDLITVNMADGRTYFERIVSMEMGADFSLNTETRGQDSGAYIQNVTGDGGGNGSSQTVQVPSPAKAFIMNTPYLRDIDAFGDGSFSIYYAGAGNVGAQAFNGAHLFISTDAQNYNEIAEEDKTVEWGSIAGTVPPPSHGCFSLDWEAKLVVWPGTSGFVLTPISYDDLWAGNNLAVIGNEVIQFKDAVQNANGSWTISNLLRGRRGTEWACDTHVSGESIIFLDATTVNILQESIDGSGKTFFFKAVGVGRDLNATPTTQITYEPRDLMPYAVGYIQRALSGSDFVLTWPRRTRLGGNMQDGTGVVALSETTEAYEVYILAAPFSGDFSKPDAPATFLRMYAVTSPTATYTAADMATDGFTHTTDTLHVVVYQISAAVGRGFPRARDIEPWRAE